VPVPGGPGTCEWFTHPIPGKSGWERIPECGERRIRGSPEGNRFHFRADRADNSRRAVVRDSEKGRVKVAIISEYLPNALAFPKWPENRDDAIFWRIIAAKMHLVILTGPIRGGNNALYLTKK
jgi:hypothetical protein